ncbi:MAG TPA: hypothetical protein ENI96_00400 [Sedimenticola thiotaurini]|uniref:Fimbrial assembly protein n=1 Tax=Sedimenticola thiotaurini TaxID=1543721 RepID=A0A831RJV6_9GAMM|nr:hypothetical protein [Sedimenticola thiotaurini]
MNQSGTIGAGPERGHFRRFLGWWGRELRGLLPGLPWSGGGAAGNLLLILDDGPAPRLYRLRHGRGRLLGQLTDRPSRDAPLIRQARRGAPLVVLRLAAASGLKRRLDLPLSAEHELRQVVRYQLDSISPYPPEQVGFACRVAERDPGRGLLRVDVYLTPLQVLQQAVRRAEARGLTPDRVDFTDGDELQPPRFDLLGTARSPRRSLPQRLNRFLVWLCLLLGAGLVAAHLVRQADTESLLQARVESARARAEVARRLRDRVRRLELEAEVLATARRQRLPALAILDELSRTLPRDTWLEALDLADDRLILSGLSSRAANLISVIENSPRLEQAGFRAPVVQDARSGRERFQIGALVSGGGAQ